MKMKYEIILYRQNELEEHLEVLIEDDTVWLNQIQIAKLFGQSKQNISLHINNCFKEGELEKNATVKESLTVQNECGRRVKRKIEYFNLDVIISVGYRVKSKQGTQFRIWANNILKDYLLKGYSQISGTGHIIAKFPQVKQADRLVKQYGGVNSDWVKKSSSSFVRDHMQFETHFF